MSALSVPKGRQREAIELVTLRKAALVGRMLLGELHGHFEPLNVEVLMALTRSDLQGQLHDTRKALKGEIQRFCTSNFDGLTQEKLSALYKPILEHHGTFRVPLIDFIKRYGRPRSTVLKRAPLHATVCISPWGLQTEFPELHLSNDLVEATRQAVDCRSHLETRRNTNYIQAKQQQSEIAALVSQEKFSLRMAIIGSFNLVEAYINGVAWEFLQTTKESIKSKDQETLNSQARSIKIKDKLTKIPRIVKGTSQGVLHETRDPLRTFITTVKPFRDSIVHASPFTVPETFGGYDKLTKLYELDLPMVTVAVQSCIDIIATVHKFITETNDSPSWLPYFSSDGYLTMDS